MADSYIEDLLAQASLELLKLRLVREIVVPSPAAGAEWIQAVPGGVLWEVLEVSYTFATSVVVANRVSQVVFANADLRSVFRTSPSVNQAASQSVPYAYGAGVGVVITALVLQGSFPSPPIVMSPGYTIRTSTGSIDAGDQYSNITLQVREWDETAIMQEAQEIDTNLEDYISRRNYTRENR